MEPNINTIGYSQEQQPNQEFVEVTEDAIDAGMSEEDFKAAVEFRLPREKAYWDKLQLKLRQDRNAKYWAGDQIDKTGIRDDQEKWAENILLRNTETRISLVTARTPELAITPKYKNEKTRTYALTIRRMEQAEWEINQMMQLMTSRAIRNHEINLLGVVKKGYDPETGEYWTEEVSAQNLVISKNGDFVAEYIKDKDLGYLLDTFPEKKKEILDHYGFSDLTSRIKKVRSSPVEFLEIWMDDGKDGVLGWKLGEVVLAVDVNPHFDRTGQEIPVMDQMGQPVLDDMGQPQTQKVFFNHFKKAKHPYIFLQYLNRGIHIYDDTTLLEQGIGLQDWVNKRKRQIGMNADSTNGHWVSSGDFISQEEFDKIEGGVDEKIWLANGRPSEGLAKITGMAMPDFVYSDLIDSRQSLNTLMGVENATLGAETNNNTLGQDVMQRQQNMGRADGYVRLAVEPFAQRWYEYDYHLHLVYQIDEEAIALPEDTDIENDNICFSRDTVPLIQMKTGEMVICPLVFQVKAGSTLPRDELMEYKKAQEAKDYYSPIDYFKKTGEANPRELTKNLLIWKTDPFFMFKDDPQIQEMQQRMMEQQAAAAEQVAAQEKQKSETEFSQKQKLEEMKQQSKDGKGTNAEGGVTDKGVANALRAEIQEAGMDPKEFMAQAN